MNTRPTLLIDGDVIVFRVALQVEQAIDWGNDLWTLHSDMSTAKQRFDIEIQDLMTDLKGSSCVLTFSEKHTFRHDINLQYKSNREGKRKPLVFPRLREYGLAEYDSECWPLLEADDVLGIMQTSMKDTVLVSIDKDMMTIPGYHYNPDHPERGVIEVTPEEAEMSFLCQAIAGDPVDGSAGCPGLGMKRGRKLLEEKGNVWSTVVEAYESRHLSEEVALMNARMARILTKDLWDTKSQQVILWEPPQ